MSVPAHVLPETSSAERLHILDKTCWCHPKERAVPTWQLVHFGAGVVDFYDDDGRPCVCDQCVPIYRSIGHDGPMPDDGEPL